MTPDRMDHAGLRELEFLGQSTLAATLRGTQPHRALMADLTWTTLALTRPDSVADGLLRQLMLRALSAWARAHGVPINDARLAACPFPACAPGGCLCKRCSLIELARCGFGEAANGFLDAEAASQAAFLRGGHRRLFERMALGEPTDAVRHFREAIAATERLAVAFGIDLEEVR